MPPGKKALYHLEMKYSEETQCQKDHDEHTKSKPAKLLTAHGTSWIRG